LSRPHVDRRTVRVLLLCALGFLLPACGGNSPGREPPATPSPLLSVDPALLAPLEGLGPCGSPPAAAEAPTVEGLRLPDGAVITEVTDSGPLTTVQGWVPLTPIQLRVHYQRLDGIAVLNAEDEVWESETLFTDGRRRLFVKAQAMCESASLLVAVVAPESQGEAVPVPAGASPSPTG